MNKMINRYKSKEGGTMIPLRFQNGGSNLFLRMPDGGSVGPMGPSPMGLPEYQTGANMGGVNEKTMQDFDHYYNNGFPMMQEGGDPNAEEEEDEDTTFYSDRMNTFIQKIRDAAEKNLETAVMEQDQEQHMAKYGMGMGSDPMNSYDPGNLNAYAKNSNYLNRLSQNAVSGYVQRMGALGPNDYYYKEKNTYKDTSKGAPLGTQTFTDANGMQSSISPEEAARRAEYALYTKRDGGSLPRAQDGLSGIFAGAMDPELYRRAIEMGHNSIEDYKNSGWGYGKNHAQYKESATYPSRVRINDPRTINVTSGNPINPNVDLKSGDYHTGVIGNIARAAREYGQNPQELIAIALQESNLGKTDPDYGHVLNYYDPQDRGAAYDMAFAKTEKDKVAAGKGYGNDELRKLQAYNGLGTVYPSTEAEYHGFNMGSIYGVPLTKAGINMVDNPLYGKRIMDLRDNVLGNPANPEYNQFLDKYNRDLANEEVVSQQQIGAYNMFNRYGPQYGNKFRDMIQSAYSDSLNNSAGTEYIYPDGDLNFGYSVPNLDNTRQRNALDRFNKGIGYEQIPYRDGGALKKYQGDKDASTTANNTANTTDKDKKTVPNGSEIIGGNGDPNMLYDGHNNSTNENTTVINGVRYAVDPTTGKVLGYNPQSSTRSQGYNYYNPYGGYNPYAAYGSMRGRNLGVVSKNRLTKDFRENMLAGNYDNAQLLGLSNIETRRAIDPGNRIKSMTFSYGQPIPGGRTTVNQPAANNSMQTSSGSNGANTRTGIITPDINSPAVDAGNAWNYRPGQGSFAPSGGWQDMPATGPVNPNAGAGPIATPGADEPGFQSGYVPGSPQYPNVPGYGTQQKLPSGFNKKGINDYDFATVDFVKTRYDKLWGAAKSPDEQAKVIAKYWYNQYQNDRGNGKSTMVNYIPRDDDPTYNQLLEKAKTTVSMPQTTTMPAGPVVDSDPTKPASSNIAPNDDTGMGQNVRTIPSTDELLGRLQGMPDNSVRQRLQYAYDNGLLNPQQFDRELKLKGFRDGGSLHKFMRRYDDGGPFSVREMSIADMPEMVDQIVEPESNNTPMEFKQSEMTDADRLRVIEGTNAVDYDPDGMAPSFDVKTKTKKKRIGNPEKDLAAINFATNLFKSRDAAYAETDYRKRTGASFNFNPMRSTEGNYDILSGDFRRGKRAADGNDAFHSGFGNYAQMGGSMMDNLKEGDEVYLTEDQINQIIKRGGKLSYL